MSANPRPVRTLAVLGTLAALLAASALLALKSGPVAFSWAEIAGAFAGGGEPAAARDRILLDLRLPRILLGALVGAALGASGVVIQAVLRNPLADPYLLGLSGGAALGAVLALVLGAGEGSTVLVPAAAFLGALVAVLTVRALASGASGLAPTALILAGVVVGSFCAALVMFVASIAPAGRVQGALFWLMGSLAAPPRGILPAVTAAVGAGLLVMTLAGHELNALSLGEETAGQLGVEVRRARTRVFLAASLATGAAVSASGLVGFVGLVVPHALRSLVGADHRLLVPAAALAGAAALVLADTAARSVLPPAEIPVGVVTALLGAPFFLVLLRRRSGWMA